MHQYVVLKSATLFDRFVEYSHHCLKGGYVFDSENESSVKKAIATIDESQLGVILVGNPGSGKTILFEMLQRIIHPQSQNFFSKKHAQKAVDDFSVDGPKSLYAYENTNYMFDDIFKETKGHFYSNKNVEVFVKLICQRYDDWKAGKRGTYGKQRVITHFTTNHSRSEFLNRYGLYCTTRLDEMCERVLIGEKENYTQRRLYKNFIGLPQVYHAPVKSKEDQEWEDSYKAHRENSRNKPPEEKQQHGGGMGTMLRRAIGTDHLKPQA